MKEVKYSNREIDEKWSDIANALARIEIQTTTTNGRVKALERAKWAFVGGGSVIMCVIIPIMGWALSILVNIDHQVHAAVDDALSAYDITK